MIRNKLCFLIVDQAKNTLLIPADDSYMSDCLQIALKYHSDSIKQHGTFKELDKTIHDYIRGLDYEN